MNWKEFFEWIQGTPFRTWVGHALVGMLIGLLADWWVIGGVEALHYEAAAFSLAFFYLCREIPGLIQSLIDKDWKMVMDHFFDLVTPFIGLVIYLVIKQIVM